MRLYIFILALSFSDLVNGSPLRDASAPMQGLYSPGDDVDILDHANLKGSILNSERAWFVEFYNSWCGFCQRFAPSWKEFATDVKNWGDLVKIAAINCADEDNFSLCAEFSVTKYPTVKYFPVRSDQGREVSPGTSAYDHRKSLVQAMRDDGAFSELQPYQGEVSPSVFDSSKDAKYAFLIVQHADDTVGLEMVLDFHKVKDVIVKYAYNDSRVGGSLHVNQIPSMYVVGKDHIDFPKYLLSYAPDRKGIGSAITRFLHLHNVPLPKEEQKNNVTTLEPNILITSDIEEIEGIKKLGDRVFQVDLENAVKYSLKREIGGLKLITDGEKLQSLRSYIDLLYRHFPFGPQGKDLIDHIRHYINHSSDTIDGSYIHNLVKESENKGIIFTSKVDWVGCRGSASWYRGYPCGLWKLFHYLIVNAENPKSVLEAMHGYIKHFFGCIDCSRHFQEMAAKNEIFNTTTPDDAVLWLWKAHNEVNRRLSRDQTEDPLFPKVQFPTKDRCPNCYNPDDITWDETGVLKYLRNMYDSGNIQYLGSQRPVFDSSSLRTGVPSSGVPMGSYLANLLYIGICYLLLPENLPKIY